MNKFGWCIGPEGARVQHEKCPGVIDGRHCGCECHDEDEAA